MLKTDLRVGISGWRYGPWRNNFYPAGLPMRQELAFASRQVNSIEINGSFYSLQDVSSWQLWYRETPDKFRFSIKGSRFITHMKKLKDVEKPLANFFAQGILALKEKLGPILWQFPPGFAFHAEKFDSFFRLLPATTGDALRLARRRDHRMKGRSYLRIDENRSLQHAVEIRHESFRSTEFTDLLRKWNIALVVADTAGKWPFMEDVTANFVYARLHGDKELYVSGYTSVALDLWARRVRVWRKKKLGVYVYFDNDVKVKAPFDAIALARRVGGFEPQDVRVTAPADSPEEARTSWPAIGFRR